MKKILLTVSGLVCALFTTHAQITIEQSDFPVPGDIILQGRDTLVSSSISLGTGGDNQTWDFSALQVYELDTLSFEDPSNVLYGDSFPNAFLAITQFGGYGFAADNSGEIEIVGFSGSFSGGGVGLDTNIAARFQDPQTIISIPANYGATFTDTSVMDIKLSNDPPVFQLPTTIPVDIDSIRLKRTVITNSEIDGWGTVTGHTGTFNCLRQVNHEYSEDSIFVYLPTGFPPFIAQGWSAPSFPGTFDNPRITDQVRYNFITKELGYYYVSILTDDQDNILSATFETVQDSCCVGVGEYSVADHMKVYPNPAVDELTVFTGLPETTNFELFDITGKMIMSRTVGATTKINIQALDKGIYLYRLSTSEGTLLKSGKLSFTR